MQKNKLLLIALISFFSSCTTTKVRPGLVTCMVSEAGTDFICSGGKRLTIQEAKEGSWILMEPTNFLGVCRQ